MSALLSRAKMTVSSARMLLGTGDTNSAISRAYYAMFYAARAALNEIDPRLLRTKQHATLIRRFGKHVVEARGFDRALGRAFAQTEDVRVAADYDEEPADEAIARKAVEGAEKFVAACQQFVAQRKR
jgi:uncharacterized protein (UPF0332 family)